MWWVWILIAVLLLGLFLWWGSQPVYHRYIKLDDLYRFIKQLFEQGEPGSFVIAEHQGSPRFLQIALTDTKDDMISFEFGFPEMKWSEDFFDSVLRIAISEGFSYFVEPEDHSVSLPVKRFLHVSATAQLIEAPTLAHRLISRVAQTINLSADDLYKVHFKGNFSGPRGWGSTSKMIDGIQDDRRMLKWMKRFARERVMEGKGGRTKVTD